MHKTEKSRPTASPAEREAEMTRANTPFPVNDDSTSADETQPRFFIAELLPQGEQNAITTKELLRLSGYSNTRDLQDQIHAERRAGALILSKCHDGGGYFIPSEGERGKEEIRAFERTLRKRAVNTFAALKTARAALKEESANGKTQQ